MPLDKLRKKVRDRTYRRFYRKARTEFGDGKEYRKVKIDGLTFAEFLERELRKAKYQQPFKTEEKIAKSDEEIEIMNDLRRRLKERREEIEDLARLGRINRGFWEDQREDSEEQEKKVRDNLNRAFREGRERFDNSFCPKCRCRPCICSVNIED